MTWQCPFQLQPKPAEKSCFSIIEANGSWFIWGGACCSWGSPTGAGFNRSPPSNRFGKAGEGAIMFWGGGPRNQKWRKICRSFSSKTWPLISFPKLGKVECKLWKDTTCCTGKKKQVPVCSSKLTLLDRVNNSFSDIWEYPTEYLTLRLLRTSRDWTGTSDVDGRGRGIVWILF